MHKETLPELADRFIQRTAIMRDFAKTTVRNYHNTFDLFFRETSITYPSELNFRVIEDWFFNGRLNRKWGAVTFRNHLKHLNPFMKWLVKNNYIKENFLKDLEKPKMEQKIPRTLSQKQATRLLEYAFNMHYPYRLCKYRNQAIIAIMLMAGLRRKEVINLKVNEVDLENGTIFINQSKGKKDRMIPINQRLREILTRYLHKRKQFKKQCINFFVSIQGDEPLGESGMKKLVDKLRKRTKINFSAHTLRHAFARLMLEGGCDIYTLSKIMGHAKITTTTIYLSCSNQQMTKSVEMHALN